MIAVMMEAKARDEAPEPKSAASPPLQSPPPAPPPQPRSGGILSRWFGPFMRRGS